MAQKFDWTKEREQAYIAWNRVKEQIVDVKPNAKHPECDCGRSLAAHLTDSLLAIESFIAFCEGNLIPFVEAVAQNGSPYALFILGQVFESPQEVEAVLEKVTNFLKANRPAPGPFSLLNFGGVWN